MNLKVDKIWHLACHGSPKIHIKDPIKVSRINSLGTYNMLNIAKNNNAKFLMASTSEIYANQKFTPAEIYKGSVNTKGVRACYREGKDLQNLFVLTSRESSIVM